MQPAVVPSPTPPSVVVSQQFVDDATRAFTEVVALREALARIREVNTRLSTVERAAVDSTIAAMDALIAVKDKLLVAYAQLDEVRVKTILAQQQIIDRLMKPKSGWAKVWAVIEKALTLAAGILIGRGL